MGATSAFLHANVPERVVAKREVEVVANPSSPTSCWCVNRPRPWSESSATLPDPTILRRLRA